MERHAPHNAPMAVKMKSIISTVPCPLESHHSLIAPARHPAAKPIETPKRHPNTKPITMPTYKCLRLSGILAASATLFHTSTITSPTSTQNALKRRFFKNSFPGDKHGWLRLAGHNTQPHISAEQYVDAFLD